MRRLYAILLLIGWSASLPLFAQTTYKTCSENKILNPTFDLNPMPSTTVDHWTFTPDGDSIWGWRQEKTLSYGSAIWVDRKHGAAMAPRNTNTATSNRMRLCANNAKMVKFSFLSTNTYQYRFEVKLGDVLLGTLTEDARVNHSIFTPATGITNYTIFYNLYPTNYLSNNTVKNNVWHNFEILVPENTISATTGSLEFVYRKDSLGTISRQVYIDNAEVYEAMPKPVPTATSGTIDCSQNQTSFDLNTLLPAANPLYTYKWYTDAAHTSEVTNPAAVSAGVYYLFAVSKCSGCVSDASVPVMISSQNCCTENITCTPTRSNVSIDCTSGTFNLISLQPNNPDHTYTWYTDEAGTTPLPYPQTATPGTYYMKAFVTSSNCVSSTSPVVVANNCHTIAGKLYADYDGAANGITNTNQGFSGGGGMYVLLVNSAGNVVKSQKIANDGSFSFSAEQGTYKLMINNQDVAAGVAAPTAATLNTNYMFTGEGAGTSATPAPDGTPDGIINNLAVGTSGTTTAAFGINARPAAPNMLDGRCLFNAATDSVPTIRSADDDPNWNDGIGQKMIIKTTPELVNGVLRYDGVVVTQGMVIAAYDPKKLKIGAITANRPVSVKFEYVYEDKAGAQSAENGKVDLSIQSSVTSTQIIGTQVCLGDSVDLRTLVSLDDESKYSFHTSWPFSDENKLPSPIVKPTSVSDTPYYYVQVMEEEGHACFTIYTISLEVYTNHYCPRFTCDRKFYLTQYDSGAAQGTRLYSLDNNTNPFTLQYISRTKNDYYINAVGYNPTENLLYGLGGGLTGYNHQLVRITANGTFQYGAWVGGLPNRNFNSGDFANGRELYVVPNNDAYEMYKIDVMVGTVQGVRVPFTVGPNSTRSESYVRTADIVFDRTENLFYCVSLGYLTSITKDGVITYIVPINPFPGETGALYSDRQGNIFANANNGSGFYQINKKTGAVTRISRSIGTTGNDGANCPNAILDLETNLKITKTVDKTLFAAGDTVTYTIVASNIGKYGVVHARVRDNLPLGIPAENMSYTAVPSTTEGSLATTTVVGTQTGAIDDRAALEVGASVTYTVQVVVPKPYNYSNLVNTVTIASPPDRPDIDESDNTATVTSYKNYWMGNTTATDPNTWSLPSNWTGKYVPKTDEDVEFATAENNDGVAAVADLHLDIDRRQGSIINFSDKALVLTNGPTLTVNDKMLGFDKTSDKLIFKSRVDAANGALVLAKPSDNLDVLATVEFASKSSKITDGAYPRIWQYMGAPVQVAKPADVFKPTVAGTITGETSNVNIRKYNEALNLSGNPQEKWEDININTPMTPFDAYEVVQPANAPVFEFKGKLNTAPKVSDQGFTANVTFRGNYILANSYTAPIFIDALKAEHFGNLQQTIYLYNTGSRTQWEAYYTQGATDQIGGNPGQYFAVPILAAGRISNSPVQIPTMQGFLVRRLTVAQGYDAANPIRFTFDYTTVRRPEAVTSPNEPMRVNGKAGKVGKVGKASDKKSPLLIVEVVGKKSSDRVYLLTEPNTTKNFDNGWDGTKLLAGGVAQIYTRSDGRYQISTDAELNGTVLGFRPGDENSYELRFQKVNMENENYRLYIQDLHTGAVEAVENDKTIRFNTASADPEDRFKLIAVPEATTKIGGNSTDNSLSVNIINHAVWITNERDESGVLNIYNAAGVKVLQKSFAKGISVVELSLQEGIYLMNAQTNSQQSTVKTFINTKQ